MRSRIANFSRRLALPLVLVTIVAGSSSSARAQYEYQTWTTVASAGTVDQKDVSLVQFDGPVASLASGAPDQSTLHIRYNVVPVDGLFEKPCTGYLLNVRYRDEFSSGGSFTVYDPGIEVIVTLKSINLGDGVVNTLLSFDSNTFPAAYGFQTQGSPPGYFTFDFRNNAYWIEAQLIRGQLSSYSWLRYHPSPAALATVQILSFNCAY